MAKAHRAIGRRLDSCESAGNPSLSGNNRGNAKKMIVTLTHADLRSIVNFYADQGVKLAPTLIARMSDEQREMAAEIYRRAGEMLIARADKLADRLADQPDRRAAQG